MQVLRSPSSKISDPATDEAGADADARFDTSLRELKDLQRQLYHAADHCEAAYKRTTTQQRMTVVENTRTYICGAVVTVVDHLGGVAASVEGRLLASAELAETERRIDCLKQRLLTCRLYAVSIDLAALRRKPELPRHLPHYVIPPTVQLDDKWNGVLSISSQHGVTPPNTSESPSLDGHRASLTNLLAATADDKSRSLDNDSVSDAEPFSTAIFGGQNHCNSSLDYRTVDVQRSCDRKKRPAQGSNFLSFLRRSRKAA